MLTENLSTLKIHKLTQEQYDAALVAGKIDDNSIYLTPDEDEIDLSLYATIEQLDSKADLEHVHSVNDVDGLQDTLTILNDTKADSEHVHTTNDISNLNDVLNDKVDTSTLDEALATKSAVQFVIWEADD